MFKIAFQKVIDNSNVNLCKNKGVYGLVCFLLTLSKVKLTLSKIKLTLSKIKLTLFTKG